MVHVPAKLRDNTMLFRVTVRKLNVTDRQTDKQTDGGHCNISHPGPSARREIKSMIWPIHIETYRTSYMRHIGRHMWPPGQKSSVQSLFSQNCPELFGILWGKRYIEMSLFLRKWGKLRENSAEKNISMEMSLFLYGNSAEMKETEGKFCRKKLEFISVRKFCHFGLIWTNISETEGNSAGQN